MPRNRPRGREYPASTVGRECSALTACLPWYNCSDVRPCRAIAAMIAATCASAVFRTFMICPGSAICEHSKRRDRCKACGGTISSPTGPLQYLNRLQHSIPTKYPNSHPHNTPARTDARRAAVSSVPLQYPHSTPTAPPQDPNSTSTVPPQGPVQGVRQCTVILGMNRKTSIIAIANDWEPSSSVVAHVVNHATRNAQRAAFSPQRPSESAAVLSLARLGFYAACIFRLVTLLARAREEPLQGMRRCG